MCVLVHMTWNSYAFHWPGSGSRIWKKPRKFSKTWPSDILWFQLLISWYYQLDIYIYIQMIFNDINIVIQFNISSDITNICLFRTMLSLIHLKLQLDHLSVKSSRHRRHRRHRAGERCGSGRVPQKASWPDVGGSSGRFLILYTLPSGYD